jgi:hypothetical protein
LVRKRNKPAQRERAETGSGKGQGKPCHAYPCDHLTTVLGKDFKFHYRTLSVNNISENEFAEFSGINLTQKPAFLRRLQFIIADKPGKIQILLFRGKHDQPDDPWKFHDKQQYMVDVELLNDALVKELVDWFAWKIYSPRSIR